MAHLLNKKITIDVAHYLKNSGKKIVFTHGAFDLLHNTHAEVLERSKKQGDILIVSIESDARIRAYKNPTRPIVPVELRARMLSALNFVDFVFILDGKLNGKKDYLALYEAIDPDLVTFGSNFGGRDNIKRGRLHLPHIQFKQVFKNSENELTTTTKLICKIRDSQAY